MRRSAVEFGLKPKLRAFCVELSRDSPSGRLKRRTVEPSHLNRRERALSDVAPRTYTTRSVPADFVARLTAVACSLLTPRWRWALALCRNAIQPGHAEQRAGRARFDERLLVGESRATIRLVADACDCAGALRGEDPAALCAVPPASVARLLAARRDPAEWRSGAGRELSATVVKSEQARRVGRATKSSGSLSGTPLLIF